MCNSIQAFAREARKQNISLEDYMAKREAGLKYCYKCKHWREKKEFPKDRSRYDGRNAVCSPCHRVIERKKPEFSPERMARLKNRMRGNKLRLGLKRTPEEKKKISKTVRKTAARGPRNPRWKGGLTPENHRLRMSALSNDWRKAVFERDHYTCQMCGDARGGNLNAHHRIPWSKNRDLRFDVSNGITLCKECHELVHAKFDSTRRSKTRDQLLKKLRVAA